MNKFKVTFYNKELGMVISTEHDSELTLEEYRREAAKTPKGLNKPLSELVSVEQVV